MHRRRDPRLATVTADWGPTELMTMRTSPNRGQAGPKFATGEDVGRFVEPAGYHLTLSETGSSSAPHYQAIP